MFFLKVAGAEEIFIEYEHGDSKIKSQQSAMFDQAIAGDTIIVLEVSRLARVCDISRTTAYKYKALLEG